MKLFFLAIFCWLSFTVFAQKLVPEAVFSLKVKEPSDLALTPSGDGFFIVSDNGYMVETDLEGKVKRKAAIEGIDFEGICIYKNQIIISDETPRHFYKLNLQTLEQEGLFEIAYNGGRNSGFEAITFNESKQKLIIVSEKNPVWLMELNSEFQVTNKLKLKFARDISAATFFDNHIWLLSDEDRTVFKLNPINYTVVGKFRVPIINPEGIAFDKQGRMYITSDDLELLYRFAPMLSK